MALRESSSVERPDHTRLIAGTEGSEFLQDGKKIVTRAGSASSEADFDISSYNLVNDGDWVLSTEKSSDISGDVPSTGGADEIVISIESGDDKEFSVEVKWYGDNGNEINTIDHDIDSDMISSSPTNGNHHVFVAVALASDSWDIVIKDESSNDPNNISGSINVH